MPPVSCSIEPPERGRLGARLSRSYVHTFIRMNVSVLGLTRFNSGRRQPEPAQRRRPEVAQEDVGLGGGFGRIVVWYTRARFVPRRCRGPCVRQARGAVAPPGPRRRVSADDRPWRRRSGRRGPRRRGSGRPGRWSAPSVTEESAATPSCAGASWGTAGLRARPATRAGRARARRQRAVRRPGLRHGAARRRLVLPLILLLLSPRRRARTARCHRDQGRAQRCGQRHRRAVARLRRPAAAPRRAAPRRSAPRRSASELRSAREQSGADRMARSARSASSRARNLSIGDAAARWSGDACRPAPPLSPLSFPGWLGLSP
jgi:hypothetical protein